MRRKRVPGEDTGPALLTSASVSADSQLSLSGVVSGIEICGAGRLLRRHLHRGATGEIGERPAVPVAIGGIVREDLPVAEGCVAPLGGAHSIKTLRRTIGGDVVSGGDLCYIDGKKSFVRMGMKITEGGTATERSSRFSILVPSPRPSKA